jgi:hypothetical protein
MRLFSGPLTRANVDQCCYNIAYGTSGALPNAGPTCRAVPKTSNIAPSSTAVHSWNSLTTTYNKTYKR